MAATPTVVCLGFPPFADARYVERLAALEGVEPLVLPIDPDASWAGAVANVAHDEPPPWARSVAAEREAILARSHVLMTLHTPDRLAERAPALRWIQGAGAGVEQFGGAGFDPDRVVLTNCAGISAPSMA